MSLEDQLEAAALSGATGEELERIRRERQTIVDVATRTGQKAIGAVIEAAENTVDPEQTRRAEADRRSAIVFPSILNELDKEKLIRPVLQIAQINGPGAGRSLVLPCPVGFGITDGASYNEIELGILGTKANRITSAFATKGAAGAIGAATSGLGSMAAKFMNEEGNFDFAQGVRDNFTSLGSLGLAAAASGQVNVPGVSQAVAQGAAIALGVSMNKNITTEFTGVGTRSFSFQYKLVPSSQDEGKTIHEITKFLRSGIYPKKDANVFGAVLRYPPKFSLRFENRIGGSRLKSIPAISDCFLESFSTTYNGNNSFHRDGVPVDTDIQLTFKETRALTLEDIDKLESQE